MADPRQVIYSLGTPLASQYTVFERDQVLTHGQLNSVATWLDQQDRLTRTSLLGVGIVAGLEVSTTAASVTLAPGLGVTTDGDLIRVTAPLQLTRQRAYEASAPRYAPFYNGDARLELFELVPESETGAALTTDLAGNAILLLAETSESDPDLCIGADCDNLGRERAHRLRVLVLAQDRLGALGPLPVPVSQMARKLPEVQVQRPVIDVGIGNPAQLGIAYREACIQALNRFGAAFAALSDLFGDLLQATFGQDPTRGWSSHLKRLWPLSASPQHQLLLDFLRDLGATWSELVTALLADDSVMLPAPGGFAKHLVAAPRESRTPWLPSALDARAREAVAQARFLLRRIDLLLDAFALPADKVLRVTPSRGDEAPLGERAIPWYYQAGVHAGWSRRLDRSGLGGRNLGYRASEYSDSPHALDPLAGSIAGFDFFRIEGHLGRPVEEVRTELKKLITQHNLPFEVHAVLAHTEKAKIKIRPAIRYTDLHRVHYLLRQDVSLRLDESKSFSTSFAGDVKSAVEAKKIPDTTDEGVGVVDVAESARSAVGSFTTKALPALDTRSYTSYRASTAETRWNDDLSRTLETVGGARARLGQLSRSDFASPLDSLIQTTHPLWLDWMDTLIKDKDERADDRLLLSRFIADHPGLDHVGGTWRGGTFVLVYDDAGQVIADFAVAYPCAEAEVDRVEDPIEPPLQRPPLRRPPTTLPPIKLVKPVDLLVAGSVAGRFEIAQKDLRAELTTVQAEIKTRLDTQTASVEGMVKGVFSTRAATGADVVNPIKTFATGDDILDEMVKDVDLKQQRVQTLVELAGRGDLSEASRTQAQALLAKAQSELGNAVADATEQIVKQGVDTSSGSKAAVASVLAKGTMQVNDGTAATALGQRLTTIQAGASGPSKALVDNLQRFAKQRT